YLITLPIFVIALSFLCRHALAIFGSCIYNATGYLLPWAKTGKSNGEIKVMKTAGCNYPWSRNGKNT
ncbi:TPA: hypothetical protein ACHK0S_003065, partial [Escherichia coli]